MQDISDIIDKIIESNFENSLYKTVYLYNELFISISNYKEFCFYGIALKSDKIIINIYSGENTIIGKILFVLLKKYEKVFLTFLKLKREVLFNIGDESEFINIFDKEDFNYQEIEERLNFSFLDDYGYRRKSEMDFKIEEKTILDIYHSDFECSRCCGPKEPFSNFPNYHNDILDEKYFSDNKIYERLNLNTNITDYESITIGGSEKINEILQDKELLEKYDLIALNKTCISVIMGDDITSVFKYNNIPEEKIFYTDQNIDSSYRAVINFLKNINVKFIDDSNKNNKIIFFGLNKNQNTFELIKFFKDNFGIIVDKILIPNINTKDLESIMDYSVGVFFTGREVKAQSIFKLYPLNQFDSSVPYGITKFKNLLNNIFINLGKEFDTKLLNNILDNYKNTHIELYNRAKKYTLAFVIYDFHVKSFLKDNFRGVPIISMLNDMGFHLSFFIYSNSDKYKKDIYEFNTKNDLDTVYNFDTIVSNKQKDLENFLQDENINCYYSELSNDKRILLKNKTQFSVGDFDYGIEGFYRSFGILIKKCEKQEYMKSQLGYYLR